MARSDPRGHRHWRRIRAQILWRDGGRCQVLVDDKICGAYADIVHHKVALADGGAPYDPANLQAICWNHHKRDGLEVARRRRSGKSRAPGGWGAL